MTRNDLDYVGQSGKLRQSINHIPGLHNIICCPTYKMLCWIQHNILWTSSPAATGWRTSMTSRFVLLVISHAPVEVNRSGWRQARQVEPAVACTRRKPGAASRFSPRFSARPWRAGHTPGRGTPLRMDSFETGSTASKSTRPVTCRHPTPSAQKTTIPNECPPRVSSSGVSAHALMAVLVVAGAAPEAPRKARRDGPSGVAGTLQSCEMDCQGTWEARSPSMCGNGWKGESQPERSRPRPGGRPASCRERASDCTKPQDAHGTGRRNQ